MIIKLLFIASLATLVTPATLTAPETPEQRKYKLLQNVQSGKCLDVERGGTANRTRIIQFNCNKKKAHQRFWFRPDGKTPYGGQLWNIIPYHYDACLDVDGANTRNGAPIFLFRCNGGNNQKFTRYVDGEIRAYHSDKCLDIAGAVMHNGGILQQWTCHGGYNQLFRVISPP
jgi:Ricin-type beta-trefoil lectin domain-like